MVCQSSFDVEPHWSNESTVAKGFQPDTLTSSCVTVNHHLQNMMIHSHHARAWLPSLSVLVGSDSSTLRCGCAELGMTVIPDENRPQSVLFLGENLNSPCPPGSPAHRWNESWPRNEGRSSLRFDGLPPVSDHKTITSTGTLVISIASPRRFHASVLVQRACPAGQYFSPEPLTDNAAKPGALLESYMRCGCVSYSRRHLHRVRWCHSPPD